MSIRDMRLLEFDEDAIRGAIGRCTRQATALGLSADAIETLEFVGDRQELVVQSRDGGHRRISALRTAELAALLIAYCAVLRVPVPRRATKRVEVTGDRVRISMTQVVVTAGDAVRGAALSAPTPQAQVPSSRAMVWE